jgi:CspA family cold shock protein
MPRGRVKWFNDVRGYGFIEQETGEDVFVHFAGIDMEGYRTLSEGQFVEYELKRADGKKLSAEHVSILPS